MIWDRRPLRYWHPLYRIQTPFSRPHCEQKFATTVRRHYKRVGLAYMSAGTLTFILDTYFIKSPLSRSLLMDANHQMCLVWPIASFPLGPSCEMCCQDEAPRLGCWSACNALGLYCVYMHRLLTVNTHISSRTMTLSSNEPPSGKVSKPRLQSMFLRVWIAPLFSQVVSPNPVM